MEDFLRFAAGVFEVDISEIDENTEYGTFEKWDSLMQLRLIMETEETYGVEVPIDDVPDIKTLKDLYAYIQG